MTIDFTKILKNELVVSDDLTLRFNELAKGDSVIQMSETPQGYVGEFVYEKNTYVVEDGLITTITELQEGFTNNYKNPVILSISCQTGWFDKNVDCFGEALTTYSSEQGFVGFLGSARNVQFSTGTPIYGPEYIQEYLPYSIFVNMSHIAGEFILESKIDILEGEYIKYIYKGILKCQN